MPVQTAEAAQRWARTWAAAWPLRDIDAIAALQAEDGDHWASLFRPYRGRAGLRRYLEESFAEETGPAEAWFAEPVVDGASASVEYWAVICTEAGPLTISGCTVLAFDSAGLVTLARDYSSVQRGRLERPAMAFTR